MRLTDRVLPPAEWSKLEGRDLGVVLGQLNPASTQIAVVENEQGAIVACWAAVLCIHAEGLWVAPEYRMRPSAARRLWRRMRAIVTGMGADSVITGARSPEVVALLTGQGATRVPFEEYVLCLQSPR